MVSYVPETKEDFRRLTDAIIPGDQIDISRITDMRNYYGHWIIIHLLESWDVSPCDKYG